MSKNSGKLLLAGIVGALAGAIGGLLLAPKSGKETREDIAKMAKDIADQLKSGSVATKEKVKEVFGEVTEEAKMKYMGIRDALYAKVAAVKSAGEEIDKERYAQIVDDVVDSFKDDLASAKNGVQKMSLMLKKDWLKVKKAIV